MLASVFFLRFIFFFFFCFNPPKRGGGKTGCSIARLGTMYMPLEVPLGELAVAPVNPVHEELVRKGSLNLRRLFRPFVVKTKLILLPLRSFPVYSKQKNQIQITVARFSHDEELLWTGELMDLARR